MDKKKYLIISIFIISLLIYLFTTKLSTNKFENYLNDYDFSVGNVDAYFRRSTIGYNVGRSSITYTYLVENVKYTKSYDLLFYKLPDNPKIGSKYIVVYNKNNPRNSLLLGNYPISKDADFKNFINNTKKIKIAF